jgi:2,3-bisphosphoglycerate-dependent phosphoglycerate mutase
MYGSLEGLSKPKLALELGESIVQQWRGGLLARPPEMPESHEFYHGNERKYADLAKEEIPRTESLQDTMERTLPLWFSKIVPSLLNGDNVLVVGHANSLRGIVKHIDCLSAEQIQKVGIPNGIPLVYKFDTSLRPIKQTNAEGYLSGVSDTEVYITYIFFTKYKEENNACSLSFRNF